MNKQEIEQAVEVCTVDDIGLKITGEDAPPMIAALNEYLSIFAKPDNGGEKGSFLFGGSKCLKCGGALSGALGTFQWGIANGEGSCSRCGWPCRAHHRPKDNEGEIFDGPFEYILQYHPSGVTSRSDKPEGADE